MEHKDAGTLYVVATPIGNMRDITLRAIDTFGEVDAVFAEDTRVTLKLLSHLEIKKPVHRYDEHSHAAASAKIAAMLAEGRDVALATDAGTPCVADPGSRLVARLMKELPGAKIVPVPGASAVPTLLSASGLNAEQFAFLGYAPHKKGRQTFFEGLKENAVWPAVFYESPHRVKKALESLAAALGEERHVVVGRELTKMHEEIFRGTVKEALARFGEDARGEFVIAVAPY